jgi:hypothetical protein
MRSILPAAVAAAALIAPIAASAQTDPSYAQAAVQDEQVRGRIAGFDGGYSLTVNDDRGYVDTVQLHQGTIINPTGLTLQSGMVVSILGYNAGSYFAANEIDTPYTLYGAVPYYGGRPWTYWGPSVSLGFFFGNTGWWHGAYFHGPYHYYTNTRVYNSAPARGAYNNSVYHGSPYHGSPAYHGSPGYHDRSYTGSSGRSSYNAHGGVGRSPHGDGARPPGGRR